MTASLDGATPEAAMMLRIWSDRPASGAGANGGIAGIASVSVICLERERDRCQPTTLEPWTGQLRGETNRKLIGTGTGVDVQRLLGNMQPPMDRSPQPHGWNRS